MVIKDIRELAFLEKLRGQEAEGKLWEKERGDGKCGWKYLLVFGLRLILSGIVRGDGS